MKRVIRLTESDLTRIVKQVIFESKKKPSIQKVEDELGNSSKNSFWFYIK